MSRRVRMSALAALPLAAAVLVACSGSQGVEVADDAPYREGAVLFAERCSGCHTLSAAGTEGSADNISDTERTDGPNFDQRKETSVQDVLYAIRNGGFSGAIMPQNIVVGEEARIVAEFVVTCSGVDAQQPRSPDQPPAPPPPEACGNEER